MAAKNLFVLFAVLYAVFLPAAHGLNRIVGGQETTIERRPYQASLQYYFLITTHSCGASIISTKHMLSAAHCDPGTSLSTFQARVGSTTYNTGGTIYKVARYLKHPLYVRNTLDYDFAIIYFDDGVEIVLSPVVAIIPLVQNTDPADNELLTVSGWGVTSESSVSAALNLREVELPVVNQDVCRRTYSFITPRQICLGGTPQGMLSACFGDSGGPAVYNGVQYGIVSGGNSCELPNIPGIFARVSAVRDWITQNTGV